MNRISLKKAFTILVFILGFLGCETTKPVTPDPKIIVYGDEPVIRWDEPLHWELLPQDSYIVLYGLDLEFPNPQAPHTKVMTQSVLTSNRSVELEPLGLSGTYSVWVGLKRGDSVIFWSKPLRINLTIPQAPEPPPPPPKKIDVRLVGTRLLFTPHGSFPLGFFIVWSKNPNPVYPTRPGDLAVYRGQNETPEVRLQAFNGTGEYFVRVFEFLGGENTGIVSETLSVNLW